MGVTYKEVVDNKLLSDEVIECIPSRCECGAPIEFTDSLRQIYCSNARCIYKVASRLEAMAKKLKVDGFGESTCITLCKEFGIISPYQVYLLDKKVQDGAKSSVSAFEKKINAICDKENRKVQLWEVVKLAGIPSIETTAYKIFEGYNSLTEAFDDIEKGQVPFIAERLGLRNAESSIMAVNIYNTLLEYKDELLFGEKQFEIYQPVGDTISIAITGGVRGYRNKSEFIKFINNRYNGRVNAMLASSVTQSIDILVADGDTSSNKFKTALNVNKKHLEKGLANGEFTQEDVGKYKNDLDIHPIGEKILITNSVGLIDKLDKKYKLGLE